MYLIYIKKCGNTVVCSGPEVAACFTVSHYFGYDFHSVCANDMMNETCFEDKNKPTKCTN